MVHKHCSWDKRLDGQIVRGLVKPSRWASWLEGGNWTRFTVLPHAKIHFFDSLERKTGHFENMFTLFDCHFVDDLGKL